MYCNFLNKKMSLLINDKLLFCICLNELCIKVGRFWVEMVFNAYFFDYIKKNIANLNLIFKLNSLFF